MVPNLIRSEEVFERARAAFLGLAVGDALGATTEFMTPAEIRASPSSTARSSAAAGSA